MILKGLKGTWLIIAGLVSCDTQNQSSIPELLYLETESFVQKDVGNSQILNS